MDRRGVAVPPPTRAYRGVPAKQRTAQRRGQLLDAGLELLGTEGWAKTTVVGVARKAGLSERYFYESFSDREALLLAVFDRVTERGLQAVLDALAASEGASIGQRVRVALTAAVDFLTADPRNGRVVLLETGSEALQRRRQEALLANARTLSALAQEALGDRDLDPTDADLTAYALMGGLAEVVGAWLLGALDVPRERLVEHLAGLFLSASRVRSG